MIPNLGYEPGYLGVRENKIEWMAGKGTYVNGVRQDTSKKLWNKLNDMTSGAAGFNGYVTSRKATFPRFVILANGVQSLPKHATAAIYLQSGQINLK